MVNLHDHTRYWDSSRFFDRHKDSYIDWEGFSDPSLATNAVDKVMEGHACVMDPDDDEGHAFIKDVLLHYVYETIDQAGEEFIPSTEHLTGMLEGIEYMISLPRFIMKGDVQ